MESFIDPALADVARAELDFVSHHQPWNAPRRNQEDEQAMAHQLAVAQLAALEQSVAEHTAAAVSGAYQLPQQHTTEHLDADGLLLNQPPTRKRRKTGDAGDESESTESPVKRATSSKAVDTDSVEAKIPKKRGRPKGSKDKPRDPDDGKPRPKRGRPLGTKNKPRDPTAPTDPGKKAVGRPRKYPPGTTRRDKKRIREREEEEQALAALAAGLGGGPLSAASFAGSPNQDGMEASTSGTGSNGQSGSASRGEERQGLRQQGQGQEQDFRMALGSLMPSEQPHGMHLELLADMGFSSSSPQPFLPAFDASQHSLMAPQEGYRFNNDNQPQEDILTGFISSRAGPRVGGYGGSSL